MNRWTGSVTVELEDVNDGTVETFSRNNMVTNAVNDIVGINPMGMMYRTGGSNDESILWNGNLLPICPNMIGGILLFGSALTEGVDNIYQSSSNLPVAYASNDVNVTADTRRGSMNLVESTVLADGYQFVWEFTPSQGNGSISAIGLTSKQGGVSGFGSSESIENVLLQMSRITLNRNNVGVRDLARAVTLDFENGKVYTLEFDNSSVVIKRYRVPVFDIGLNERLDDSTLTLEDTQTVYCSTFEFGGIDGEDGIFLDGDDGYWYGFSNDGNSSGNATLLWVKIKQSDYSVTEGSWTLTNAKLMKVGTFEDDSTYAEGSRNSVVRGGYLYVPAYDKTGVYKINLSNRTDVTKIDLGFTGEFESICSQGNIEVLLALIGDLIVGYGFEIDASDRVKRIYEGELCGNVVTPFFRYKEFLVAWGDSYGTPYRYIYLLTPYLATICNLAQAVVKNTDKTMKITYTLRESSV